MSSPYDRYDRGSGSRRRGVWTHWIPLALTVTVATVGVAAWIWNQRKDDKTEELGAAEAAAYQDLDYENADYGDNPAYGATGDNADAKPSAGAGAAGYGPGTHPAPDPSAPTWGAQMSGALRRTPSPQQFLDSAKRTVIGGVTAAGAVVGSALAAIREEDKTAYADHETWSEEADAKKEKSGPSQSKDANKRRKKVVIVISADNHLDDTDSDGYHEHAVSRLWRNNRNMFPMANTISRRYYPTSRARLTSPRSSSMFSSMRPI